MRSESRYYLFCSAAGREPLEWFRPALSFAEEVAAGLQAVVAIDAAGGPGDLHEVDAGGVAQAEVEPRVGRRLEAGPSGAPGRQPMAAGDNHDPGADCVAAGARPTSLMVSDRPPLVRLWR